MEEVLFCQSCKGYICSECGSEYQAYDEALKCFYEHRNLES